MKASACERIWSARDRRLLRANGPGLRAIRRLLRADTSGLRAITEELA
ncbi:hypothetical protein [Fictibacillus macauensis]|nr:hypothetical protein [Fictibacillus macauensis]